MDRATRSGRWPIVGRAELATVSDLDATVIFRQDKISAYESSTGTETPLTFEEADRLECAAVWDPEHVEDRLRDYFSGVPNKWWASMRPETS